MAARYVGGAIPGTRQIGSRCYIPNGNLHLMPSGGRSLWMTIYAMDAVPETRNALVFIA